MVGSLVPTTSFSFFISSKVIKVTEVTVSKARGSEDAILKVILTSCWESKICAVPEIASTSNGITKLCSKERILKDDPTIRWVGKIWAEEISTSIWNITYSSVENAKILDRVKDIWACFFNFIIRFIISDNLSMNFSRTTS